MNSPSLLKCLFSYYCTHYKTNPHNPSDDETEIDDLKISSANIREDEDTETIKGLRNQENTSKE